MEIFAFQVTPFAENCYVLKDGGEAIIIDPGEAPQELFDAVADSKVTMVFNTHCHIDHCAGNAAVLKKIDAPLVCHKDAVPMLEHISEQGSMFGFEVEPSPKPDRFVEEGDTITVGNVTMTVAYTPGHAPGHVSLIGDGFVFDGDVLFNGSIGRTDLPGGDMEVLMNSIKEKLLVLPDDTVVLSGHGPKTTIGAERHINPFLQGL